MKVFDHNPYYIRHMGHLFNRIFVGGLWYALPVLSITKALRVGLVD